MTWKCEAVSYKRHVSVAFPCHYPQHSLSLNFLVYSLRKSQYFRVWKTLTILKLVVFTGLQDEEAVRIALNCLITKLLTQILLGFSLQTKNYQCLCV